VIAYFYRLATVSEFRCTKPAGCTIDTHSPHCHTLVIFVALLTCGVRARSEVCWSGSAQPGFHSLPTSCQL